jgi:hypothetical protein
LGVTNGNMLRWTTRLRDILEIKNYRIGEKASDDLLDLWYTIREAEFVCPGSSSPFPEDLNWDTFTGFYSGSELFSTKNGSVLKAIILRSSADAPLSSAPPAMGRESTNQLIRSFSARRIDNPNEERIDVLWLSPTVFVSSFNIFVKADSFYLCWDCYVTMSTHQDPDNYIHLHFYSLPTFETTTLQYSDLPLQFFRKITASLPTDFFSFLELGRDSDSDVVDVFGLFPLDYYSKFLSIVSSFPSSAHGNRWTKRTTLRLPRNLDADELQAILSHHFQPSLVLMFNEEMPFVGSVSLDDVNDLLRESRVSSLKVPKMLASFFSRNESFAANSNLRSLALAVFDADKLDESMLGALSRNCSIEHLEIWFHSYLELHDHNDTMNEDDDDSDDILADFRESLLGVFGRKSHVKSLTLHILDYTNENPDKTLLAKIFLKGMDPASLPTLGNLSFFNVSLRGVEKTPLAYLPRKAGNVQGIRNWDEVIAPWLVLNFYRGEVLEPVSGGLVPLAVQAINWGGVYRQTTSCAPSNMDIVNAGLIFHVFRRAVYSNNK